MKYARIGVVALVAASAACATWRWSGSRAPHGRPAITVLQGAEADESRRPAVAPDESSPAVSVSTYAARPAPVSVPPTPESRAAAALYYSDMGPDALDVSAYPAQERRGYAVYARACSRCHTLARSINAPLVARGWWEFYMMGMRLRSRRAGRALTSDETKAILEFLEYDSRARKVERARDFDALTEELKARFDASMAARLKKLQKSNARVLSPSSR